MLAFARNDTRLIVGVDNGSIYVYDTAELFSSGSDTVNPLRSYNEQPGALRQIAPNPGMEPDLADMFAVVRSDGVVHLMNTMLESLGGWSTVDSSAGPVAVSWSPKGKHLAIGLRSGDILTFAPNNKSTPSKQIPPAAEGRLVGLNWLSPGHTFRLTYAPQIEGEGESVQQIVSLDAKSGTLTVFDTLHPYTMSDRQQESHALTLPHWDEDSLSENSKVLIIVGDRASVDLEILGGHNGQWYQQSQENPLSLPLDKQTEETTLMILDVDLTDLSSTTPIAYAYLNDGSLQAWHLEHSKPYLKMVSPTTGVASAVPVSTDITQDSAMDEKDAANVLTSLSNFNQLPSASPFGAFGSGSGQQNSVFGTASQPTSVFGQTSQPTFGRPSAFGSLASNPSTFGQPATFGSPQPTPSPFVTTGSGNAFANLATQRGTTNVFGSSSFGSSSTSPPSQLAPPSDEMTREASMSDGTAPSFGGLSLGGGGSTTDDKPKTSIFGTPASTSQASTTSSFGGLIKPAQGFGAFGNFGSPASSQDKPAGSAFLSPPQSTPHSAFGQTSFGKPTTGQPTFGQPAFGQTSFGQTGFGKPSAAPSTGGFAAFATSSASPFGSALQSNKATAPATGGFTAFASGGVSAFGIAPKQDQPNSNASPFSSKSPFSSDSGSLSPFGSGSSTFGNVGNAFTSPPSSFGLRENVEATTTPQATPARPSAGVISPPSSPEPTRATTPLNNNTTSVFGLPAPSSSFVQQPTGFGALKGLPESSPFFKKPKDKAPIVTAFGNVGSTPVFKPLSSASTTGPAFGSTSQLGVASKPSFSNDTSITTPAFGATSQLGGGPKSTFGSTTPTTTPTKPPPSGGFSAFSGGTSAFSAFAGQKSSFSDLLKKGDKDEEGPEKSTSVTASKQDEEKPSTPSKPVSVFASLTPTKPTTTPSLSTTPKTPTPTVVKQEESTTPKEAPGEEKSGTSLSTLSVSSIGSFVDVTADKSYEEAEEEGEYEGEGDDARSFLSSDFSSGPPTDEEASDEEDQSDKDEGEAVDKGKGNLASTLPPLPETRSPSLTPQPEVPSIEVTPSPPAENTGTAKPSSAEESTTPPGSPSNEAKALSKSPSPTPFSTPSTPSSSSPTPFGGALGRPSTRPARSSPLAAAPVSGADEEEEEGKITEEPVPKHSASPSPLSRLSPAREEPVKQEEEATAKRPHTPPLLSAFNEPAVGTSIPTVPVAPKPEPAKTSSFLAPSPTPSPQPVSVFVKPSEPPVKQEVPQPATFSPFTGLPAKSSMPSEAPQAPKTAPATPTGSPFSLPPFSLAPRPMSAPQSNQATPGPSAPPFKPPVFAQGGQSPFSIAPKPPTEVQGNQTGPSPFGAKTLPSPFGLQFGPSPAGASQSAPTLPAKPVTPSVPQPPVGVEEGLQKECIILVKVLENEFKELIETEAEAIRECAKLSESTGGSRLKGDLGVLDKWRINDATTFGQTLMQFESDLIELGGIREVFKQALRELNSSMLKANTKREEIARFDKAKNDKEFAKMLSTRSLGPEHLESQQQLRRNIRAMRDRVQKLESHLQESKKKLSQAASGRPSIRAPTLDVINRTYRNIDMAVQQQMDEVAGLAERVKKLKIKPTSTATPSRDARLPDQPRRSIAITPHVAVTTAAALNAERSAQKLKKALLKARKEPILNVKAASAPPPVAETEMPKNFPPSPGIFGSVKGPLFSIPGRAEAPLSDMNFNIPEDDFHPGSPPPPPRRGAGSNPKKHSSVPLKKTPGGTIQPPPPAAPTADFWGPLPVFNNPPLNQLAAEVKPVVSFVPLTPSTGPSNPLPGGGFEAFIKPPS
ncbi:hypothetical protein P691DRAFT_719639 [Macrolepiota fuliginosa MF-IS2]|uniref:Nucleoporin Nup159/Nup146 N-terminal domain-containing protein n=1 Tax=Macrolepiota fuliginosa MF-IS2 TaxID=1400762 RepID=A0A9P5XQJ8_9AGAR|nr:hypothetical protein P691DRAFT_719639 [Macrolepiota fuliginosa MF-IS2]